MDRISNLPDELVCHILSFLSTKEAALTSPLAKRWRNLFVFSPNLRFEYIDFVNQSPGFDIPSSFRKFLERVLDVSGNAPIKNLSLKCSKDVESADINLWIRNLLTRGVLERLHLVRHRNGVISLPLEVFTCKTLVTLKVMGFVVPMVPENACLPSLKTLYLGHIRFSNRGICAFEILLSACSVLEELEMHDVETMDLKHCTVSSLTLKILTLCCPNYRNLTFYTPSLTYLESYNTPNLDGNLDSIVEAKLDLKRDTQPISNPENLIKSLRNVRILNLSTPRTMKTLYTFRKVIPVFKNLNHLSIPTIENECCLALPLLLENAPNLETFVIRGLLLCERCGKEPESIFECLSGAFLLTCRVKVLKINMYKNTILGMRQLTHFLEKLTCLELLKVRWWATDEKERLQLSKNLLKLPRSSKCKIHFDFGT